jgi:hypothetical protein
MRAQVEFLLEDDHESLGRLLGELDLELAKSEPARALELLDLFWARLAVHIRAEHLHLFPALADVPVLVSTGGDGLPSASEVNDVLARLRSDHDFFMKELAQMMKIMRRLAANHTSDRAEHEDLRQRLSAIATRLEAHNQVEETQAYQWPTLFLDDEELAKLHARVAYEVANLPPRLG